MTQANTIDQVQREASKRLSSAGIETARLDVQVLVGHVLGLDRAGLIAEGQRELTSIELEKIDTLIERRVSREPIAYITKSREFWGLEFSVGPGSLVPRPDSETLIEAVLMHVDQVWESRKEELRLLDLGTGTGCLLLALLSELPAASGLGADVNPEALKLAEQNAASLELSERAEFVLSNWTEKVSGTFDVIISNPPYIPSEELASLDPDVAHFEPHLALDGGEDGLVAYRQLGSELPNLLKKGGLLALEIGEGQAEEASKAVFSDPSLVYLGSRADLAGIPRVILGQKVK